MSGEGLSREMAEALLLAMDGDFLPGAGMGLTNAGWDIPFDQARPKEIAHWAAGVLAPFVARRESEAAEKAWDEGHQCGTEDWGHFVGRTRCPENPYRADSVAQGREESRNGV